MSLKKIQIKNRRFSKHEVKNTLKNKNYYNLSLKLIKSLNDLEATFSTMLSSNSLYSDSKEEKIIFKFFIEG